MKPYDAVFVHENLLLGDNGTNLVMNLQFLLSHTPVIVMGSGTNYGAIMSLCDFSAFLRWPFSMADFLHYILKYVFEIYEAQIMNMELQKIPKKHRLRYQVMKYMNKLPEDDDYLLVGIPVAISLDDKVSIDEYIEQSRFSIPDCYQLPITGTSTPASSNSKETSQNLPIPLLSPQQEVQNETTQNERDDSLVMNLLPPIQEPVDITDYSSVLVSNVEDRPNDNSTVNDEEPDVVENEMDEPAVKAPRKRVSAGKKLVRRKIDDNFSGVECTIPSMINTVTFISKNEFLGLFAKCSSLCIYSS